MITQTGPLFTSISGPFNKHFVLRTRRDGKIIVARKATSMGRERHNPKIQYAQKCWNLCDAYWRQLPPAYKVQWAICPPKTARGILTGFIHFKKVNLKRMMVGLPPVPQPPDMATSRTRMWKTEGGKRSRVLSEYNPKETPPGPKPPKPPDPPPDNPCKPEPDPPLDVDCPWACPEFKLYAYGRQWEFGPPPYPHAFDIGYKLSSGWSVPEQKWHCACDFFDYFSEGYHDFPWYAILSPYVIYCGPVYWHLSCVYHWFNFITGDSASYVCYYWADIILGTTTISEPPWVYWPASTLPTEWTLDYYTRTWGAPDLELPWYPTLTPEGILCKDQPPP